MKLMRLKATKTSLYKLVSEYEQLPPMKKTGFYKAFRSPNYSLNWSSEGIFYHAFFAACSGKPLLSIQKKDFDREIGRETYDLSIRDLRERGMIDEAARVPQ